MATTIKLKNGSGAPLASDLVQGEPALDLTNKRLYSEDSGGTVIEIGTNPSTLSIAGTAVTATAAELNILDGVTATAAELNILDGVTATTAELNILDGVTATFGEINLLDGSSAGTIVNSKSVIYGAAGEVNATTLQIGGVSITSTAAELNILDGKAFLDEDDMVSNSATGIPSQQSVKAYVDSQVASADTLAELTDTNITTPADGALLFYDTGTSKWIDNVVSGDITIADTGVAAIGSGVIVNADINASAAISVSKTALVDGTGLTLTGDTLSVDASQTQITAVGTIATGTWQGTAIADAYVADNLTISGGTVDNSVIGGTTAAAGTFTNLTASGTLTLGGTAVTSTAAEINLLDGVTATTAEINYLDVTTLGTTEASKAVTADANGDVTFAGDVTFSNAITEDYETVSDSLGTTTVDLSTGTNFSSTLSANTQFAFTSPASNGSVSAFTLKIVQDASASGYTVTWPTSVNWPSATAPTLTATASAVDYFVFITHDGGTNWYGFTAGQAFG